MPFSIRWTVDENEWLAAEAVSERETVGSEYDDSEYARDELLDGRLWLDGGPESVEEVEESGDDGGYFLAPSSVIGPREDTPFFQGYHVRILDFAWQLADELSGAAFVPRSQTSIDFKDFIGPLRIRFLGAGRHVFIYTSFSPAFRMRVDANEWSGAIDGFLVDFVHAVRDRAPLLLTWNSMQPLARYVRTGPGASPSDTRAES